MLPTKYIIFSNIFLRTESICFPSQFIHIEYIKNFLDIPKKKIHLSDCFNDSVLLERTAVDESKPNC